MDDTVRPPCGHRLRIGRRSEAGRIYLLTSVTHRREPLFRELRLGRAVVEALRLHHDRRVVYSLAFVVMPDHLHWLVELRPGVHLNWLMHSVKGCSARRVNELRGRRGAVWQRGYHDRAVRREEDIPELARYVVANPLRHGLVSRIGAYPLWDAVWL